MEVEELRYKQAGGTLCEGVNMEEYRESQMIQNLGAGVWQTPQRGWVWCDRWCRQQIHRIMQVAALQVCSHIWSFRKTQMAWVHFKGTFSTLYSNILSQFSYSVDYNSKCKNPLHFKFFLYIVIRTLQEFSPAHAVGRTSRDTQRKNGQNLSNRDQIIQTFCPRGVQLW